MKHTVFIAGIVAAGMIAVAGSSMARPHDEVAFEVLDRDGNGEITLEEMQGAREARFNAADADGDGRMTRDELIAASRTGVETRVDRMIERFDSDGDGAISLSEMPERGRGGNRGARMFERADADGSGGISREEFDAVQDRMAKRHDRRKPAED